MKIRENDSRENKLCNHVLRCDDVPLMNHELLLTWKLAASSFI